MIETDPPGEWAVDNTLPKQWAIINVRTGRRKVIGPVHQAGRHSKVNYFDRALDEAMRRNRGVKK